jgi:hypothetical protein
MQQDGLYDKDLQKEILSQQRLVMESYGIEEWATQGL